MSNISTRPLNAKELATLTESTSWVNELLEKEFLTPVRLTGTMDDIPTLHSILGEGPYTSDAASELTTFGIVFGHVLAKEIPLKWVMYGDEHGEDFALQYQGLNLFVFPCDLLIKRAEEGEAIDEMNLEAVLAEVRESLKKEAGNASKSGS